MAQVVIPESRKPFAQFAHALPDFADRDKVPSVGQVLALRFGPLPDAPYIQIAADRGKKAHLACELYDVGDLDEESIAGTDLAGYLRGWQRWCGQPGEWALVEAPLWARIEDVPHVGVVDRVGYVRGIIDIKTKGKTGKAPLGGSDEWKRVGLQLAAYAGLLAYCGHDAHFDRRQAVFLWPNGHVEAIDYTRWNDVMDEEWRDLLRQWKRQHAAEEKDATSSLSQDGAA